MILHSCFSQSVSKSDSQSVNQSINQSGHHSHFEVCVLCSQFITIGWLTEHLHYCTEQNPHPLSTPIPAPLGHLVRYGGVLRPHFTPGPTQSCATISSTSAISSPFSDFGSWHLRLIVSSVSSVPLVTDSTLPAKTVPHRLRRPEFDIHVCRHRLRLALAPRCSYPPIRNPTLNIDNGGRGYRLRTSLRLSSLDIRYSHDLSFVVGGGSVRRLWSTCLTGLEDRVQLAVITGQTQARLLGRHQFEIEVTFSFFFDCY